MKWSPFRALNWFRVVLRLKSQELWRNIWAFACRCIPVWEWSFHWIFILLIKYLLQTGQLHLWDPTACPTSVCRGLTCLNSVAQCWIPLRLQGAFYERYRRLLPLTYRRSLRAVWDGHHPAVFQPSPAFCSQTPLLFLKSSCLSHFQITGTTPIDLYWQDNLSCMLRVLQSCVVRPHFRKHRWHLGIFLHIITLSRKQSVKQKLEEALTGRRRGTRLTRFPWVSPARPWKYQIKKCTSTALIAPTA